MQNSAGTPRQKAGSEVEFESCISMMSHVDDVTGRSLTSPCHSSTKPPVHPPSSHGAAGQRGSEQNHPQQPAPQPNPQQQGVNKSAPATTPTPPAESKRDVPKVQPTPPDLGSFTPPAKCRPKVLTGWNFYSEENMRHLKEGGSLYNFICASGPALPPEVVAMIKTFITRTNFEGHPHGSIINMDDEEQLNAHVFIFNKAQYVLPFPTDISDYTTKFISSVEYQKNCQPQNPKIWTDVKAPNTFRFTKTVIPYVYKVTLQMCVTELPPDVYELFRTALCDGVEVHKVFLIERTKRDTSYVDSTKCVKSLLLFHKPKDGGVLITSITAIANTALPLVIAKIIDNFAQSGALEVSETAENTRKFLGAMHAAKVRK
ncbi:aspartate aminotransferase [Diplonema papillatum]|nr:aspartate aminotransferase [Diplonema papillatum]